MPFFLQTMLGMLVPKEPQWASTSTYHDAGGSEAGISTSQIYTPLASQPPKEGSVALVDNSGMSSSHHLLPRSIQSSGNEPSDITLGHFTTLCLVNLKPIKTLW